eukprot:6459328-Amphidinium_carterae.1
MPGARLEESNSWPINADTAFQTAQPSEFPFAAGAGQPWRTSKVELMLWLQAELMAGSDHGP